MWLNSDNSAKKNCQIYNQNSACWGQPKAIGKAETFLIDIQPNIRRAICIFLTLLCKILIAENHWKSALKTCAPYPPKVKGVCIHISVWGRVKPMNCVRVKLHFLSPCAWDVGADRSGWKMWSLLPSLLFLLLLPHHLSKNSWQKEKAAKSRLYLLGCHWFQHAHHQHKGKEVLWITSPMLIIITSIENSLVF